jgi:hypothetical protein
MCIIVSEGCRSSVTDRNKRTSHEAA